MDIFQLLFWIWLLFLQPVRLQKIPYRTTNKKKEDWDLPYGWASFQARVYVDFPVFSIPDLSHLSTFVFARNSLFRLPFSSFPDNIKKKIKYKTSVWYTWRIDTDSIFHPKPLECYTIPQSLPRASGNKIKWLELLQKNFILNLWSKAKSNEKTTTTTNKLKWHTDRQLRQHTTNKG